MENHDRALLRAKSGKPATNLIPVIDLTGCVGRCEFRSS